LTILYLRYKIVIVELNRNIFARLCDDLDDRRASLLVGARQVGKTFLLKKVMAEARRRGRSTAFFDLEQPTDMLAFHRPEASLPDLLRTAADVVLIDEFHYLANASQLIKAVFDAGARVKIYASGSSAMEMHRHLKESLAGRKILHRIFPCSVSEMVSSRTRLSLADYLVFGGMPGLVHLDTRVRKKELLADILQSYVLKDIKALIREENIRAFNTLLYLLAERQGGLVSAGSLARDVGLTPHTIESYLETMAQTYVVHVVPSFSNNLGNELRKSRKVFLYDLGVRNALLRDFRAAADRPDGGAVVESFVLLELARCVGPGSEIRFWRTKAGEEVDFIWVEDRVACPIEVKAGSCAGRIPAGVVAFLRRYPKTRRAFVLHGGPASDSHMNGCVIHFRAWEGAASLPDEIRG
jgi:uncharacterized protein